MLLNPSGLIFIGERRGPVANAWQMPQGGIDLGEPPDMAARRELREEIGTDNARLLAQTRAWYAYDLPPELAANLKGGRYRGQTQKWFAFRFLGDDGEIDLDAHQPEFSRWRWASGDEVLASIVPFKRPVYEAVLNEFRPLLPEHAGVAPSR